MPGMALTVHLPAQCVTLPDGGLAAFDVEPFAEQCLVQGLNEFGYTLSLADDIAAFERGRSGPCSAAELLCEYRGQKIWAVSRVAGPRSTSAMHEGFFQSGPSASVKSFGRRRRKKVREERTRGP